MASCRAVFKPVTGGDSIRCLCELGGTLLLAPLVGTWEEGGGVKDEGMTEAEARSSFNSDLKEWVGSAGEAGPSVDGRLARLCCDAFTTGPSSGASCSTVAAGLATAASEADMVGVLDSALMEMVARSGRSEAEGSRACYAGRKRVRPRDSGE